MDRKISSAHYYVCRSFLESPSHLKPYKCSLQAALAEFGMLGEARRPCVSIVSHRDM